jgi:hypothetical protein
VPIDPGSHEIELVAPPHPKRTTVVTVPRGGRIEWSAPSPSPGEPAKSEGTRPATERRTLEEPDSTSTEAPSSTQRTLGLVSGGVGIAGLVTGAIFGVISISAHSSVVGRCPTYPRCSTSDRTVLDDTNAKAENTGTISTVAVIAGLALLAGGALLYFTAPSPGEPKRRAAP